MDQSRQLRCWMLTACFASLCIGGCSGSPYDADVKGVVTLDGRPVGPGVVTFAPSDGKGNPSRGNLDADGKYFLLTKHDRGVHSGSYSVAVQAYKASKPIAPGERSNEPSVPLVPEKYLQTTTSGLSYEVEPGSQTIDISLTSD